jgi:hypothetical protein
MRHHVAVHSRSFVVAPAVLVATSLRALVACGGSDHREESVVVPMTTLDPNSLSGVITAQNVVVRDPATWSALWTQHTAFMLDPKPPLPEVDFSKNEVLGVFVGPERYGCYSVQITKVTESAGATIADFQPNVPSPGTLCAAVVAHPADIVAVPLSNAPVQFESP